MTVEQAIERVIQYQAHEWVYEVADTTVVVVGGNDWLTARAHARAAGYNGPCFRVLASGNLEACS